MMVGPKNASSLLSRFAVWFVFTWCTNEPPHNKTNHMIGVPAKTQISLGIRPVWSESSLSAWRKLGSLATQWVKAKTDQTGRMPRLTRVFAGSTCHFVLSWGGSNHFVTFVDKVLNRILKTTVKEPSSKFNSTEILQKVWVREKRLEYKTSDFEWNLLMCPGSNMMTFDYVIYHNNEALEGYLGIWCIYLKGYRILLKILNGVLGI